MGTIKNSLGIFAFFLGMGILLISCHKEPSDPNENWVAGEEWVDARDGKAYSTVQIGDQAWMAENFNFQPDSGSWVYENQMSYATVYGRLYSWETAVRICPSGWHLPLQEEWQILFNYLGGDETAGGILKESGTSHWDEPNSGASNSVGFSALPGGVMWAEDHFADMGMYAHFWTSSKDGSEYSFTITLDFLSSFAGLTTLYMREGACSVRYIRD